MSLQDLSDAETTLLGVASGLVEVTIMQPTIFLKNATQQQLPLTANPRVLYRGYLASATNMAALTGLQFMLCGMTQKVMTGGKSRDLTFMESNIAGFVGGFGSGPLCCLLELVMIQQQRFAGTFFATPGRLISTYGTSSLMRGLVGASLREGIYTAGFLGMNPFLVDYAVRENIQGGRIIAPLVSALVSGTLSHPVDTFKTCMQGDVGKEKYGSVVETCKTIHAERGLRGFFNGWFWRCPLRQVPSFFILQEARMGLAPIMFPSKCKKD